MTPYNYEQKIGLFESTNFRRLVFRKISSKVIYFRSDPSLKVTQLSKWPVLEVTNLRSDRFRSKRSNEVTDLLTCLSKWLVSLNHLFLSHGFSKPSNFSNCLVSKLFLCFWKTSFFGDFHISIYFWVKIDHNCSWAQLAKWSGAGQVCYPREFDPSFWQSFTIQIESDSNVTELFRSPIKWRRVTPTASCSLRQLGNFQRADVKRRAFLI